MNISVKESYDKIAKYFSVTRIYTWKWTDNFIHNLDNNSLILDIGSGNGRNTYYSNHIIIGIDISIEQLKMKQNKKKMNDIQCNMINIPFKDNIFDTIICIASFHHLKTIDDREKCLKEIKRVIKFNGKILLSIWSINQPKKTKRIFTNYGDNIVEWNTNEKDKNNKYIIIPRYYYIFKLDEIKKLLEKYFLIDKYYWDSGNEIFELRNC
tara:strand:+ start:1221 stop:1850 length:630 start_codon:yes stop_codon:yes gene_type:complete